METTEETTKQLGRPVNVNSARQQRLAARQAKIEAGEKVQKGRPVVEGSARQLRLKARAEKIAAGVEVKRGRPKMVKPEAMETTQEA